MCKKLIISLVISTLFLTTHLFSNSIAEAGYVGGVWGNDIEIDDSSVYYIDKNHIRVVLYIIMNRNTGGFMQDTVEVAWGKNQFVKFKKIADSNPKFLQELKHKILKYCQENYTVK